MSLTLVSYQHSASCKRRTYCRHLSTKELRASTCCQHWPTQLRLVSEQQFCLITLQSGVCTMTVHSHCTLCTVRTLIEQRPDGRVPRQCPLPAATGLGALARSEQQPLSLPILQHRFSKRAGDPLSSVHGLGSLSSCLIIYDVLLVLALRCRPQVPRPKPPALC